MNKFYKILSLIGCLCFAASLSAQELHPLDLIKRGNIPDTTDHVGQFLTVTVNGWDWSFPEFDAVMEISDNTWKPSGDSMIALTNNGFAIQQNYRERSYFVANVFGGNNTKINGEYSLGKPPTMGMNLGNPRYTYFDGAMCNYFINGTTTAVTSIPAGSNQDSNPNLERCEIRFDPGDDEYKAVLFSNLPAASNVTVHVAVKFKYQ